MRWAVLLVLCTGCLLGSKNQEGLQLTINDMKQAQTGLRKASEGMVAVVKELNDATVQERPPVVAPLIVDVTESLAEAADSLDEAGKTATTIQGGIGKPKPGVNLNFTKAQKEAWRAGYTALAAAFNMAKDWIANLSPVPIPGVAPTAPPAPWSGTDIAMLIGAITTGLGAVGVTGQKVVSTSRKNKKLSLEAEILANHFQKKCNGDNEFADTMRDLPTIARDHRVRKVDAI